jgi:hypothetical protein
VNAGRKHAFEDEDDDDDEDDYEWLGALFGLTRSLADRISHPLRSFLSVRKPRPTSLGATNHSFPIPILRSSENSTTAVFPPKS